MSRKLAGNNTITRAHQHRTSWCWSTDRINLQGSCTQNYMHYSARLLTTLVHTESNTRKALVCSICI